LVFCLLEASVVELYLDCSPCGYEGIATKSEHNTVRRRLGIDAKWFRIRLGAVFAVQVRKSKSLANRIRMAHNCIFVLKLRRNDSAAYSSGGSSACEIRLQ
jgi:hypothetical protein